jgi:metal-responsive CopG/Arc/MetJ family transcriptional regulator
MTTAPPTISIRLPENARRTLDKATKLTRRSRSFLMKEALDRHLADIVQEQSRTAPKRRLSTLLSLAGAGARSASPRTQSEIDQHIRWLRDNG